MAFEQKTGEPSTKITKDFKFGEGAISYLFATTSDQEGDTTIFECRQGGYDRIANSNSPVHIYTLSHFELFWKDTIIPTMPTAFQQLATDEQIPLLLHPFSELPVSKKIATKTLFDKNSIPAIPKDARVGDIFITITHIARANEALSTEELVEIGNNLRGWARENPDLLTDSSFQLQKALESSLSCFKYFVLSPEERKKNKGFQQWDDITIYKQLNEWFTQGFRLPPKAQQAEQVLVSILNIANEEGIEVPFQKSTNPRIIGDTNPSYYRKNSYSETVKLGITSDTPLSEIRYRDFTDDQIDTICKNLTDEIGFDGSFIQQVRGLMNLAKYDFHTIIEEIKQKQPDLLVTDDRVKELFRSFSSEAIQSGTLPQFSIVECNISFTQKKENKVFDRNHTMFYLLTDDFALPIEASNTTSESDLYLLLTRLSRFRARQLEAVKLLTPFDGGNVSGNRR